MNDDIIDCSYLKYYPASMDSQTETIIMCTYNACILYWNYHKSLSAFCYFLINVRLWDGMCINNYLIFVLAQVEAQWNNFVWIVICVIGP